MTEGSEALYLAAKMVADNIAEFGTLTDGEFLDVLDIAVALFYEDHPDKKPYDVTEQPYDEPFKHVDRDGLMEALKGVMASLAAAISLLERAQKTGSSPSEIVASNRMFKIMMRDYDASLEKARELFR